MTLLEFESVDALLADARSRIRRYEPAEAARRVADGALLVDIRPAWQRAQDGEIPGSIIVERNHLEWRLHPASDARLPQAAEGQEWIVFCTEGYTSSLAVAALTSLGIPSADVIGGIKGWGAAGFRLATTVTAVETVVTADPQPAGAL